MIDWTHPARSAGKLASSMREDTLWVPVRLRGKRVTDNWTLESIRALRDADGNEPARCEGFATADPGRALQWIRLTFESGHQRAWEQKHRGPWVEIPGLSGTPEAVPVDYIVVGRHVVGREVIDD